MSAGQGRPWPDPEGAGSRASKNGLALARPGPWTVYLCHRTMPLLQRWRLRKPRLQWIPQSNDKTVHETIQNEIKQHMRPNCYIWGDFFHQKKHAVFALCDDLWVLFIGRVLWIDICLGSVDGSRAGDCCDWYLGSRSPIVSSLRLNSIWQHIATDSQVLSVLQVQVP